MHCIEEDVAAPIADVWEILADFCSLQRWHPSVVRCERLAVEGKTKRRVSFADWWAEESLEKCDPGLRRIEYAVTAASRAEIVGFWSEMRLAPLANGQTRLRWYFKFPQKEQDETAENPVGAYCRVRVGHLRAALGLAKHAVLQVAPRR